jgi:hypothetical protein
MTDVTTKHPKRGEDMSYMGTKTYGNPKGFNPAALAVVDALGGYRKTGMCLCPLHNDRTPSLSVSNGDKVPVVLHCFGCGRDDEIIDYLKRNGDWPNSANFTSARATAAADESRDPEERWRYARDIWQALIDGYGERMAGLLHLYTDKRGLSRVPPGAVMAMPISWARAHGDDNNLPVDNAGMVLPVVDKRGKFRGIHVTWLNPTLDGKREEEPKRQTYGLLKGNFVELEQLDYKRQLDRLFVGEGSETTEAATQLAALLLEQRPGGIASGGSNMPDPPDAREYILLVDVDANGGSRKRAGMLAAKLVGHTVRIATPPAPENAKPGYDWNDALLDARGDEEKLRELARALVEAPMFESVMTELERREVRLNALAAVRLDDPFEYDLQRTDAAEQSGVRVRTLDEETLRRMKILHDQREAERSRPTPVDMELLQASARDIIDSEDVLNLFVKDASQLIAGEAPLLKIIYLAATTRLFDKAMHLALKGTSAVGKSQTRKVALSYFPPETIINFTTVSEKALLYMEGDFQHKVLSMGEAHGSEESELQNYLLRELMSEGILRYPVSQKLDGRIVTVTIEKHGPVCFMVTTTKSQLNQENETRMLSLELDDSEQQTRAVIEKSAVTEGLNRKPKTDFKRFHDYQRWLAAGEVRVKVPYALTLARLIRRTNAPRLRRDFTQFLLAIKAHAVLHRAHRRQDDDGVIIATYDDYEVIRRLMADLLATAVELKRRQQVIETVDAVEGIWRSPWTGDERDRDGASVREVGAVLNLDMNAAWRRLRSAEDAGLIVNLESHRGRPGRYRLTNVRLQREEPLLPTRQELEQARERERRERERAAGREQRTRSAETSENPC